MALKWGKKNKQKAAGSDSSSSNAPERISNRLERKIIAENTSDPRSIRSKLSRHKRFVVLGIVGICLISAGGYALVNVLNQPEPEVASDPTPEEVSRTLREDYRRRVQEQQRAPSLKDNFVELEQKMTQDDGGSDDNERFGTYSQAAFWAVELESDKAAKYAKKALTFSQGMSDESKKMNQGMLDNLRLIANGEDYRAQATQ